MATGIPGDAILTTCARKYVFRFRGGQGKRNNINYKNYSLLIFILAYPPIDRYISTIVNKIRRMIKSSFFVGKHKIQKLNSMGFAFPLIQEFGFRHTVQLDGCGGCGLPVHVVSLAVLPQTESRVQSSE